MAESSVAGIAPQGVMLVLEWSKLSVAAQKAILESLTQTSAAQSPQAQVVATEEIESEEILSYPLNVAQASKLLDGVEPKTREFLVELVKDYDEREFRKAGAAWMAHDSAWRLAHAGNKSDFARSVLAQVQRRLRTVSNDSGARLVVAYDQGGVDAEGCYFIDSWLAVQSLREAILQKKAAPK